MTTIDISNRSQWGAWLQANHPELYGPGILRVEATPDNGCRVYWPESAGPAPTAEEIMAWEPPPPPLKEIVQAQLDPDEESRKALLRDLRSEAMAALLANNWTQEQAQAAGQQFCHDYAVDLFSFEFGAHRSFFTAVAADQREWLDLPWPGHVGKTIRDIFTGALG